MSEPSEHEISQILEIAQLDSVDDRDMVIQALKSGSRSPADVINELFNDAVGFRQKYSKKWDESMFAGDRDHLAGSFHVEAPNQGAGDNVIYGIEPSADAPVGAPSRPPSRANERTALDGLTDWTAANAGAVPSSQAEEDESFQRALRESAQEAGIPAPQQETGVIGAGQTQAHFGPANRDDYDTTNWAMVPSSTVTALGETSIPASRRKRPTNMPAFLLDHPTSPVQHRLGGFLTILHGIPLARNMLLQSGTIAPSYGHNSQWWKGQEIVSPHVLAKLNTGELRWEDKPASGAFEEEIHRLMAFLDMTERSYGSASVLAQTVPAPHVGVERQFYEIFGARNENEIAPFFTDVILTSPRGGDDVEPDVQEFGLLDLESRRADFENIGSLYQLIDQVMWGQMVNIDESEDDSRMALFRKMGEIITINIGGDGPGEPFDIPEELYPERWLESRKEEALRILRAIRETRLATDRVEKAKKTVYNFHDPKTGRTEDTRDVAIRARQGLGIYREYLEGRGRFRTAQESEFDADKYPDYQTAPPQMTEEEEKLYDTLQRGIDYADSLLEDGKKKIAELDRELERIRAKQRFLSRLLTKPNKPGRPKPMQCKKYMLSGIATVNGAVYTCQRAEEDLIELDEDESRDQWWRLQYTPNDEENPVKVEILDYDEVIGRVWLETRTMILVYATEAAIHAEPTPLPPSLERFVKADNKAFRQELNQESTSASIEPDTLDMRSPPKRKHREDSVDSIASNRASDGSVTGDGSADPFVVGDVDSTGPTPGSTPENSSALQHKQTYTDGTSLAAPPPLPRRHVPSDEKQSTSLEAGISVSAPREMTEMTEGQASGGEKVPEMQQKSQMPSLRRFLTGEGQKDAKLPDGPGDMEMDD